MMRNHFLPVPFLLAAFIPGLSATGQVDVDTAYYNRIEPVEIRLSKVPHGSIMWQESADNGSTWSELPSAGGFTLSYSTDTSTLVRAAVVSGSCDTIFSQVTCVRALLVQTESVDSLSDESAVIRCRIEPGDVELAEYGILFDDQPQVGANAEKIAQVPPVDGSFSIALDSLEAGTGYYVRAYGLTAGGTMVFGNILGFSPVKLSLQQNYNMTEDSVWIRYGVTGVTAEEIDEHGIFLGTVAGSLPAGDPVAGSAENGGFMAVAGNLEPGASFYVQAFIRLGESYYYSDEKKITTWSDYSGTVDTAVTAVSHRILWNDPATAIRLNPPGTYAEYGRVARLGTTDTLLLVYHGGPSTGDWINIYLRKSYDNGETWRSQEILMDLADYPGSYWRFCTPEILCLQDGSVLVAFEANSRPDENQSSVQLLISRDSARTWEGPVIYRTGRTWEPAMVQLPKGEIELFYSSEAKWWPDDPVYQDIQVIRSTDYGQSWSDPRVAAYYPEKRDGMPVPVVLQGNNGVAFAIETVGSNNSPYIVHRDMDAPWVAATSDFLNGLHRWWVSGFSGHGGAPYLLQLPGGETVLSAHIYRGGDWHQNNFQEVMIGDSRARNFEGRTLPWGELPWGEGAVNNSLFLKNGTTIVTISSRMFLDGTGGLDWLEGMIVPK
jgi:hypothetical protein